MNEIFGLIQCYLKLKDDYKEYNKENLYDVVDLFTKEVIELKDEAIDISCSISDFVEETKLSENKISRELINIYEENLLNEIADVLLTTARLIKEFKLVEPLTEMIEYKYHRQLTREEKIKNELLK